MKREGFEWGTLQDEIDVTKRFAVSDFKPSSITSFLSFRFSDGILPELDSRGSFWLNLLCKNWNLFEFVLNQCWWYSALSRFTNWKQAGCLWIKERAGENSVLRDRNRLKSLIEYFMQSGLTISPNHSCVPYPNWNLTKFDPCINPFIFVSI